MYVSIVQANLIVIAYAFYDFQTHANDLLSSFQSYIPEIFLLEGTPELQSTISSSQASSYRADSRHDDAYQQPLLPGSYRDKRAAFNSHKPVPPIQSGL